MNVQYHLFLLTFIMYEQYFWKTIQNRFYLYMQPLNSDYYQSNNNFCVIAD